jgi:hypothetical protein
MSAFLWLSLSYSFYVKDEAAEEGEHVFVQAMK